MNRSPVLEVAALTFEYPGKRALSDLSFALPHGAVLALVGPNGAGKTTLMRSIAGLDEPMSGSITLDGVDVIAEPREAYRKLGYLSDFFGLYGALTVRQSLLHAAGMHGLDAAQQTAAVALTAQRLDLTPRLDARTDTLSRGWRQRVAIGQAMVHAPQVLLLDEPAAGLDPEARIGLAGLFRQLRAEGMTLIVSSHILAELDEYSSHMLAIKDGRAVEFRALEATVETGVTLRVVLAQAPADQVALRGLLAAHGVTGLHPAALVAAEAVTQPVHSSPANPAAPADSASPANPANPAHPAHPATWSVQGSFKGSAADQAMLLKSLVGADLGVMEFSIVRENLHESYLRSMRGDGSAGVPAAALAAVSAAASGTESAAVSPSAPAGVLP